MSIFIITNFTRYSTEDLEKCFDYVEKTLQGLKPGWIPALCDWRRAKDSNHVAIKDYNPQTVNQFTFLKGNTWSREDDFGIISPDKLWKSPVEQIAALDLGTTFPREGVACLLSRIWYRYTGGNGGEPREPLWTTLSDLPKIRVMPDYAQKVDIKERQRVAQKASRNSWTNAQLELKKLKNVHNDVENASYAGIRHLTKSKITLTENQEKLERQLIVLKESIHVVTTLIDTLLQTD